MTGDSSMGKRLARFGALAGLAAAAADLAFGITGRQSLQGWTSLEGALWNMVAFLAPAVLGYVMLGIAGAIVDSFRRKP